ncbi:uncharacterized protein LOC116304497 [Actinia tenebrosa]|uniref:Uncharacterized protein LOC116304497 n=1 Tax=Actinia tenebrosa TaxID=6105 RepID=A0A6P8ISE7_ACTTE|nr:uncharacterized protein LOC116304497 [Actinia tenebrosa]
MLLHKAVQENNMVEVKKLLKKGVDVNAKDRRGNTVLHFVRDEEMTSLLLSSSSIDLNIQNDNGDTAVHIACIPFTDRLSDLKTNTICSRLKIMEMLLGAGASPNIQNQLGYSVLHFVFVYGGIAGIRMDVLNIRDIVALLLKYSADANLKDFEGCTPLHHAVREPNMAGVAELLLQAGANVDAKDRRGMTPLHLIFDLDDEEMVKLLLGYGGSINEKDVNGTTVLSSAVLVGNESMVELLLADSRTEINLGDLNGITALHLAAAYKRIVVCEMLIVNGADVNALDACNATSLHYAAYGGTPEIVSLLLQANASHEVKNDLGYLPIQYALDRHYFYTALAFGEEYKHEVIAHLSTSEQIDETTELQDWILQSFPADDVLTMIVPASKVYSDPYNQDILPPDTMDYIKTKTNQNSSAFVRGMTEVPGIGRIPDIEEARAIRVAVESYIEKVSSTMADVDPRFRGSLLYSGSVYEGTKICDPYEFDYMLCLEMFEQVCSIQLDYDTQFDNVQVSKDKSFLDDRFDDFFNENQLQSDKVMTVFVEVARKAISQLSFATGSSNLYLQSLTEHTLVEGTWILPGTVTCNLKLIWNGLYYKQLVICVDLVPAIHINNWLCAARKGGCLLTDNIMSKGCHVVSKSGYWRLSFSLAEKMIMENLSSEQKLAFVGAKVMLHPAVSAKITIYDDSALDDLTNIRNHDSTIDEQDDVIHGGKQEFTAYEASSSCFDEKSFHSRDELPTQTHDDGHARRDTIGPNLAGMMIGRVMTTSGSPVTAINVSDKQALWSLKVGDRVYISVKKDQCTGGMYKNEGGLLRMKDIDDASAIKGHDCGAMNDERRVQNATVRMGDATDIYLAQGQNTSDCRKEGENPGMLDTDDTSAAKSRDTCAMSIDGDKNAITRMENLSDIYLSVGESDDDHINDDGSDSDIPAKTIDPRDVLSTYLLKMVFFYCLEQNMTKSPEIIVTTEQIFKQIYDCLKEKRPLPYYFMQNHNIMDKMLESEDLHETELTIMMLNTFLSQKL